MGQHVQRGGVVNVNMGCILLYLCPLVTITINSSVVYHCYLEVNLGTLRITEFFHVNSCILVLFAFWYYFSPSIHGHACKFELYI